MITLETGCVAQRYCIAILQKLSIKDEIIPIYLKHDLIHWSIDLINKFLDYKIHIFCPEFASAMLANIIRTHSTVEYLEKNQKFTAQVKYINFINIQSCSSPCFNCLRIIYHTLFSLIYYSLWVGLANIFLPKLQKMQNTQIGFMNLL
jgi:hypothetical protein